MWDERDLGGSCLKALGCGCLVLVALGVLAGGGTWWWADRLGDGVERAQTTRQSLDERFGSLAEWTPGPGWEIGPRLDVFLRVREGLSESCEGFSAFFGRIDDLDSDPDDGEEPGLGEVLSILGPALRLPSHMSRFVEERNRLLADEGMGFGEYAFLFVVVYLGGPSPPGADPGHEAPGDVASRDGIRAALLRGLGEIGAAVAAERPDLAVALEAERQRQEDGGDGVFPDGLPREWADAVEARREGLAATRCRGADEVALSTARRRGATIIFD